MSREMPILFSTPMVQAIIEGTKTQTRRVIKLKKEIENPTIGFSTFTPEGCFSVRGKHKNGDFGESFSRVPYKKNDILWVRETFFALGKWIKNGKTETGRQKYRFIDLTIKMDHKYMYLVNSEKPAIIENNKDGLIHWYKRPAIFMPKEACRIKLLIEDRRAERLNQITTGDAICEGIKSWGDNFEYFQDYGNSSKNDIPMSAIGSYCTLWEKINGKGTWDKNPWVWVIQFKVLTIKK